MFLFFNCFPGILIVLTVYGFSCILEGNLRGIGGMIHCADLVGGLLPTDSLKLTDKINVHLQLLVLTNQHAKNHSESRMSFNFNHTGDMGSFY